MTEQERAIDAMRQRLAGAQAVLDMRGGGVVPQQPGSDPNTDSIPAMVGGGDQVIPTRRTQLPENTFRGLPAYPTGAEDTGKMSREYAEQPGFLEKNRQQYGILPTMAAWGLGQAVSWGATGALTAAMGAPIPTVGLGPAVMAGTLAAYGKLAGKQPVKMEHGGIVPETMPGTGEDVPAMLQPGEVVVPKREGLSQTELFRAKMARENAGLPGMGTVPLPQAESVPVASGAQQTVSMPTTTVKPPELSAEELFNRKMGLENRGIPTAPLAEALAHHQANWKPPELPEQATAPMPAQTQGSGWETLTGAMPEETGILPEQPDADQRQAGVSGGAGSLFGQQPLSFMEKAANFAGWGNAIESLLGSGQSRPNFRLPGASETLSSGVLFNEGGKQNVDGGNIRLTDAIEKLTSAVEKLTVTMNQQQQVAHAAEGGHVEKWGPGIISKPHSGQTPRGGGADAGNAMISRMLGQAVARAGSAARGGAAAGAGAAAAKAVPAATGAAAAAVVI